MTEPVRYNWSKYMTRKTPKAPSPKFSLLMLSSREIGAAEFKAHCLEIMDEVERAGTEVTITKHRKPVARLIPVQRKKSRPFCGSLKNMIVSVGDVLSPIDVTWTNDESNFP